MSTRYHRCSARRPAGAALFVALLPCLAPAQVHYFEDGRPWKQRVQRGPDAEVPGWFYNLGRTGLRVELVADAPCHLVVRHVFDDSPAAKRLAVGDHIVGAGGGRFERPHQNGYGMDVFGAAGPVRDFAAALERAQAATGRDRRRLSLTIERQGQPLDVVLKLPRDARAFGANFPVDCDKSERVRARLVEYLAEQQHDDGSWGSPPRDLFAPLALLASGERKYRKAVERCARFHARSTKAKDHGSLINWRYCAAGILLSEYHAATGAKWVLPELEQVRDFLLHSQYIDLSQVNPRVRETHPRDWPETAQEQHGGWGHNPGFEGYGPIAMITGQAALALALMHRAGVEVPAERLDAAYAFLARGTGANGYVWYGDEVAGDDRYADMGRTGAAALANWFAPVDTEAHRDTARAHAACIGAHPESFPDTHGSPVMGMVYAALACQLAAPEAFRNLLDQNRWWFTLAETHDDGTFYYQPNRDNAGYGPDARLKASAAVALMLSAPRRNLLLTGR